MNDNHTSRLPGPEHGMMFILQFDDTEFVAMDYTTVALGFRVWYTYSVQIGRTAFVLSMSIYPCLQYRERVVTMELEGSPFQNDKTLYLEKHSRQDRISFIGSLVQVFNIQGGKPDTSII